VSSCPCWGRRRPCAVRSRSNDNLPIRVLELGLTSRPHLSPRFILFPPKRSVFGPARSGLF
jgi:hypothetical protein